MSGDHGYLCITVPVDHESDHPEVAALDPVHITMEIRILQEAGVTLVESNQTGHLNHRNSRHCR